MTLDDLTERLEFLERRIHCSLWLRFLAVLVFSAVLITAGNDMLRELQRDTREPVTVISTDILEETVAPGGVVTIVIDRIKVRDCPLQVLAHWIDRNELQVKGGINPGGVVGVGAREITVRVPVPKALIPGREWGYAPVLNYQCPEGPVPVRQPPAWVFVE